MDGSAPPSKNGLPAVPRTLSIEDLAGVLQVDPKTIRRWRSESRLPDAIEIGGVVRWDPRVLDAWLQESHG